MCEALTKKGTKCSFKAVTGSDFCKKHQDVKIEMNIEGMVAVENMSAPAATSTKLPSSNKFFDQIFKSDLTPNEEELLFLPEMTFTESFDANKLAFIVSLGEKFDTDVRQARPDARNQEGQLKKYFLASKDGEISVKYVQAKTGLFERYYARKGLSGQGMVREARHTIFHGRYRDIDIKNCHPVIIRWLCQNLNIKCDYLSVYIDHRDKYINELCEHPHNKGLTYDKVKGIILSINNGGQSAYDELKYTSVFIERYYDELADIREQLSKLFPYFKEISDKLKKKQLAEAKADGKKVFENLEGSFMSRLCCFVENQLLMRIFYHVLEEEEDLSDSILCFDGIMIPAHKVSDTLLDELEYKFSEMEIPIQFSEKELKPLDLTLYGFDPDVQYKYKPIDFESASEEFNATFESGNIQADIKLLLKGMGRTPEEFVCAMTDSKFRSDEISYWAIKYCRRQNQATNDFSLSYNDFEMILKQLVFSSELLCNRFICYFINEFFVFGANSSECWIRAKVTKHNQKPLMPRSLCEFKNVNVCFKNADLHLRTKDLFSLIKGLPYHKFTNQCHIWDHDVSETETFSTALPFAFNDLGDVSEDEIPEIIIYYLKEVICSGDADSWTWLRSYLANVVHQPNKRTETMLVLYSQEKRCGKSTLKFLLDNILGEETNVSKVESLSDVFGDRGSTSTVGKRVVFFEELTDKKTVFRACMDRMKTCITDAKTTYKPLYKELQECSNTNEYVAATNHLVGVLEDRQTILHVSNKHQNDRAFYTRVRAAMDRRGCDLFASYLKNYQTQCPMQIHKTKIYESMLHNGAEPIEVFLTELKSGEVDIIKDSKKDFVFVNKSELYSDTYLAWCILNSEKPISFNHFKEKLSHYDRAIEYKKVRVGNALIYAFTFPLDWFE